MHIEKMNIPDVLLIKPVIHGDERGWFVETYQQARYQKTAIAQHFVQDNMAHSSKGTLRGLHAQHPHDQGKLVQVIVGEVLDVAVDIRHGSPWFGQWVSARLSAQNKHQFWVPAGFAHAYIVLSESAIFSYKCTDLYAPKDEISIRWNDPALAIDWQYSGTPLLSEKDQKAPLLAAIPQKKLPLFKSLSDR